jgi:hypothetical protein
VKAAEEENITTLLEGIVLEVFFERRLGYIAAVAMRDRVTFGFVFAQRSNIHEETCTNIPPPPDTLTFGLRERAHGS